MSQEYAEQIRQRINDFETSEDFSFYDAKFATTEDHGTAHVSVLAPNGDAVSVTSSVNF